MTKADIVFKIIDLAGEAQDKINADDATNRQLILERLISELFELADTAIAAG